jgi:hypothetical protein
MQNKYMAVRTIFVAFGLISVVAEHMKCGTEFD